MAKAKVQVGERYTTVGGYPTVWIVEREIHGPTVTPHFQLSQEGQPSRVKTLSESVLLDTNQYRKLTTSETAAA
ncbi:MAG: hypothetical protein FJX42_06085 [Alphaproteobacteria bacterium]|nr:hypothetical protein [Alphaproteobacteria bacterium]